MPGHWLRICWHILWLNVICVALPVASFANFLMKVIFYYSYCYLEEWFGNVWESLRKAMSTLTQEAFVLIIHIGGKKKRFCWMRCWIWKLFPWGIFMFQRLTKCNSSLGTVWLTLTFVGYITVNIKKSALPCWPNKLCDYVVFFVPDWFTS